MVVSRWVTVLVVRLVTGVLVGIVVVAVGIVGISVAVSRTSLVVSRSVRVGRLPASVADRIVVHQSPG